MERAVLKRTRTCPKLVSWMMVWMAKKRARRMRRTVVMRQNGNFAGEEGVGKYCRVVDWTTFCFYFCCFVLLFCFWWFVNEIVLWSSVELNLVFKC